MTALERLDHHLAVLKAAWAELYCPPFVVTIRPEHKFLLIASDPGQ